MVKLKISLNSKKVIEIDSLILIMAKSTEIVKGVRLCHGTQSCI